MSAVFSVRAAPPPTSADKRFSSPRIVSAARSCSAARCSSAALCAASSCERSTDVTGDVIVAVETVVPFREERFRLVGDGATASWSVCTTTTPGPWKVGCGRRFGEFGALVWMWSAEDFASLTYPK